MKLLEQIITRNKVFTEQLRAGKEASVYQGKVSKYPERKLAILTCMDTRLVDFLEPALGIKRGEVKIIKTAGNTITETCGAVIRSFMVAIYELGVEELLVVGHDDCGMVKTTAEGLIEKMKARGVQKDAIYMIHDDLIRWADYFHYPDDNVRHTVEQLRHNPFIPKDIPVHGLIIDPDTGIARVIVNGYDELTKLEK